MQSDVCFICGQEKQAGELIEVPYTPDRTVTVCEDHPGVEQIKKTRPSDTPSASVGSTG